MIRSAIILLASASLAPLADAQVHSMPGMGDQRLRTIEYQADQVVELEVASGYQLSIELAPDERIESVAVGDSASWIVTTNQRGSHLFLKPVMADANTNMTVITDSRIYLFDLRALASAPPDMAYNVRFVFAADGPPRATDTSAPVELHGTYRLGGDRRLRPSQIGDDGKQTFIEWPPSAALPAVYAVDERGEERLANGAMREGLYVVDSVSPRLIFRIDRRAARATRMVPKARR